MSYRFLIFVLLPFVSMSANAENEDRPEASMADHFGLSNAFADRTSPASHTPDPKSKRATLRRDLFDHKTNTLRQIESTKPAKTSSSKGKSAAKENKGPNNAIHANILSRAQDIGGLSDSKSMNDAEKRRQRPSTPPQSRGANSKAATQKNKTR